MIRQEDVYKIGRIGKPHGVRGELSLMFDDDVFDRVDTDYLILMIDGILVPFFFDEYRFKGSETALVSFSGINTKEKAQELTGCDVYFPVALYDGDNQAVPMHGINGFTLIDAKAGDKAIGTITHVDDSTANMLLNVHTDDGRDILIPAAEEFITGMDTAERTITVSLPDGLLDLDKA